MSRRPGRRASSLLTGASALLVLLPVAAVVAGITTADGASWERVAGAGVPGLTLQTVLLVACTVVGSLVVGGGLAWLTTAYDFPLRTPMAWLLVLPTAVPGYILGLVWSSLLSYAGPVQSAFRAVTGSTAALPVRTLPVAAVVLTLALYPYVYLLARTAVAEQAATPYGAARTLGLTPWQAGRRVVLPMARPALAAGSLLVAVEALSDFATVSYFGVDTLSVGIYRVWRGQFDRPAASVLALVVLLLALGLVGAERVLRRGARYAGPGSSDRRLERVRLTGGAAAAATGACLLVLGLAVVVPLATLLVWSSTTPIQEGFLTAAVNSVLLAAQVAAVVVVVGLVVVHAARVDDRRRVHLAVQATLFGYAVPGPVLAIGALLVFAALRDLLDAVGLPGGAALVTGSVTALVIVYALRFLALGYTTLDARLSSVSPSVTAAALTLGARPRRVLTAVHLPLARSGVAVAAVLVAVDALKELPVMLLLRPFGFETLSVQVWRLAADSRYEVAGLPALAVVLAAMIPVVLLFRAPDGAPADAAHPHGAPTVPSEERPAVPA